MPPALPPIDRSLTGLLQRVAGTRGEHPALRWHDPAGGAQPNLDLTHADLSSLSEAAAAHLQAVHGIRPGDRVAWLGLNHPAHIVLLFALARLGAMLVPLNHRLALAEWREVLADCAPRLLVHDLAMADAAGRLADRVSTLSALDLPVQSRAKAPDGPADARDLPALLVYTSGTTGRPKAAVHTQGNLLANMAIAAQVQGLNASDTVLTVLPLFHVGGLCIQTLPALSVGATVLLHARFDAQAVLTALQTDRPSLTLQVPATLKALIEHPRWAGTDLGALRAVWAGSSILPPEPLAAFHARGVPVCNVYGSTETGPFSIALPPEAAMSHAGACGWPAPGVAVKRVDGQDKEVAPGEVGELCIRAPNVAQRYWPDTPSVDPQGFFHTGDLAMQARDGSHTIVGRAKDMIISGGENIYPAEIENVLLAHPLVSECCVIGQPDARWGEVATAVIVLRESADAGENWAAPLQAHLEGRLARYKWPRRWHLTPSLPKTALGKVQKAELSRRLQAAPAAE